ncbi:MAG: GNAT family N-acetyltransferase [Sandaracinaceae bacterium]
MENTIHPPLTSVPSARPQRAQELIIRPAQRAEMPLAADIVRSSAAWYARILDNPEDMAEHQVDEAWADKNYALRDFYLGFEDGEAVGTLSLQYPEPSYCYIGYVYLYTRHVGKGYGRRFLRFAASRARARDCTSLVLIAHPKATWAVRAYEKFGFERVAERREAVLAWNDGWLKPYYEEGFHLFRKGL